LPNTPTASDAGASKYYIDSIAVQSRAWKEVLLVKEQVLDGASGGVRQAILIALSAQPTANDTFILTDGTTTETFTFKASESAAFDVAIGGSAAATLTNLIQAINDDSTLWLAVGTTGLDPYFASGYATQGVIYRETTSGANDRVYGTLTTATSIKVVAFTAANDYNTAAGVETNLPSSDPAAKRFGFSRLFAALATNETHPIAEDVSNYTWDIDDQIWRWTDQSAIVGGAGILRTGSVLDIELNTAASATGAGVNGGSSGLEFDTTGNAGKIRAAVSATGALQRASDGLSLRLPATNPALQIASNELDVKYQTLKGLNSDASGLFVKVDGTSITFDGSGNLQASSSAEAQRIENDIPVNAAVAVADPVHYAGANNRVEPSDASNDAKAKVIGVATTAQSTVGQDATVVSHGTAAGVLSGASVGAPYYLQNTNGIGTGLPSGNSRVIQVGVAKNATDLWVRIIDYGKKAA
jgi:hypothetical protein